MTPFAIKLNNQVGPTSDINVRKALSHAFDYDAAMEAISGRGTVMEGPLATALEPWHKNDLPVLRHDMEAAKAALAASAVSPTASRWTTSTSPADARRSSSA